MSEDFKTTLYPTQYDNSGHFATRIELLISIRSWLISILSAAIATRKSVKIGFCLIPQQPNVWGLQIYALSHSIW